MKKEASIQVNEAFDKLHQWFSTIVNPMENVWKVGVTNDDDRNDLQYRLSNLVGKVNNIKKLLQAYINGQISEKIEIKPLVCTVLCGSLTWITNFKIKTLPADATTNRTKPPLLMIAATFQTLNPWFQDIIPQIKPFYAKCATDKRATFVNLGGLASEINAMKEDLVKYVNSEVAKRYARVWGASAGGEEAPTISDKQGYQFLLEYVLDDDVEIDESSAE